MDIDVHDEAPCSIQIALKHNIESSYNSQLTIKHHYCQLQRGDILTTSQCKALLEIDDAVVWKLVQRPESGGAWSIWCSRSSVLPEPGRTYVERQLEDSTCAERDGGWLLGLSEDQAEIFYPRGVYNYYHNYDQLDFATALGPTLKAHIVRAPRRTKDQTLTCLLEFMSAEYRLVRERSGL